MSIQSCAKVTITLFKNTLSIYHTVRLAAIVVASSSVWQAAHAVPSFARQTDLPCSSCHVGGFGPQLSVFGRTFKLNGYTLSKVDAPNLILSATATGTTTKTQQNIPFNTVKNHFRSNNNTALQDFSIYFAGQVKPTIGIYSKIKYSGIEHKTDLDTLDLRYTTPITNSTDGSITPFGVSLNNNPTTSDPFNAIGIWSFPFIKPEATLSGNDLPPVRKISLDAATIAGIQNGTIDPSTITADPSVLSTASNLASVKPLLEGRFEGSLLGLTSYTLLKNKYYIEGGLYASQPNALTRKIGIKPAEKTTGVSPYLRTAYTNKVRNTQFSAGLTAMQSQFAANNSNTQGVNTFTDIGIDGSLQYEPDVNNLLTITGSFIDEKQDLAQAYAAQTAEFKTGHLSSAKLSATYIIKQTWGLSLGVFDKRAKADAGLYGTTDIGKRKTPDNNGYIIQADWTPLAGSTGSSLKQWFPMLMDTRIGLQYTGYNKFNGSTHNYDNLGRNAKDNNTIMGYVWFAW